MHKALSDDAGLGFATEAPRARAQGRFVAVVGPSGAGKDTVLKAAAEALADDAGVHFVRRVITREADTASEGHATLSPDAFLEARERGDFCLSWGAHGLFYGLPADIDARLEAGETVIANLSRTALADAARRFGAVAVVEITARPEILAARIAGRGREDSASATARVARRVEIDLREAADTYLRLDNSDALEPTVDAFVAYLRQLSRVA